AAANLSVDFASENFDSEVETFVANSGSVLVTLIDSQQAISHFQETLNENDMSFQCAQTHEKVGYEGEFTTFFHDVSGTAKIIDNCTIEITNFNYDGQGPRVYFYGSTDHMYLSSDISFNIGERIDGTVFQDSVVRLQLPPGKTFDDLNTMSVWCADFNANFGEVRFSEAPE
ncbi:MAG: DM13 domain-containing protein, partial [Kangiellaceae bacterium]